MDTLLIITVGYTGLYKEISYHLDGKSVRDWFSARALLKLLEIDDWKESLHVIAIYPDNDGARQAMERGFEEGEIRKTPLTPARQSINSIFQGKCKSYKPIPADEENFVTQDSIMNLISYINSHIEELSRDYDLEIMYDLTHSYRHLSFGGFLDSMLILDYYPELKIDEVYYAAVKQPLTPDSVGYYTTFSNFLPLTQNIGMLRKAIEELRPKQLLDLAEQYEDLARSLNGSKYMKSLVDKLKRLSQSLFVVQSGGLFVSNLSELEAIAKGRIKGNRNGMEKHGELFDKKLKEEVRALVARFKSGDKWSSMEDGQLTMAEISLNQQYDIVRMYSFVREANISWMAKIIPMADGREDNAEKDHRFKIEKFVAYLIRSLRDKDALAGSVKEYAKFASDVNRYRNSFAHVFAGRKSADEAKYKMQKKKGEELINEARRWFADNELKDLLQERYREVKNSSS